ncbi:MAG: hypothetical protein QOJ92_1445 [Frankiales bacterium]|nr:hypothetical protein [Frankiales bacterium]
MSTLRTTLTGGLAVALAAIGTAQASNVPGWSRGQTEAVSVAADGSYAPTGVADQIDVSADGRYVVFLSQDPSLAKQQASCGAAAVCESVYVRDLKRRTTTLVASRTAEWPTVTGHHTTWFTGISPDGRYVAFSAFGVNGATTPAAALPEGAPAAFNLYVVDRRTGAVQLASRNNAGVPAQPDPATNGNTVGSPLLSGSFGAAFSRDGRYLTFTSDASNLGGEITSTHVYNVYRRDMATGRTDLVSVDGVGAPLRANAYAYTGHSISGDGTLVAFDVAVRRDTCGCDIREVYVWSSLTRRSIRVSTPVGLPLGSDGASISLDGSHLAFFSDDALVSGDKNNSTDVYEYDVKRHRLALVSFGANGKQAQWPSRDNYDVGIYWSVTLSHDGRFVAFDTRANLGGPSATDGGSPLRSYIRDTVRGTTRLVSVWSNGAAIAGDNGMPRLSADGRTVAFMTTAAPGTVPAADPATAPRYEVLARHAGG